MSADADRFRFSTLAHAGRSLLGPLSVASVDALLAHLAPPGPRAPRPGVLDVGCGKGEILVRAVQHLGATGLGIDPNPGFLADARACAHSAGVDSSLELHAGTFADAALADATFDLVICTGSTHVFGDWRTALAALATLVRPGGHALAGVGYWRQPPAPEYLAAFGGSADELGSLAATVAAAGDRGWRVVARHESTPGEWDDYERGYAATLRRWLDAHPDDPDAPAFRARIEGWSAAYERWGRATMGFVTLLLAR